MPGRADPQSRNSRDARSDGPLVVIATMLETKSTVGVSTHVVQVAELIAGAGQRARIVTPQSLAPWASRALLLPGRVLRRVGSEHAVRFNRYLHRCFLELALRSEFRRERPALVYAQDPRSAHAALQVRGAARVPIVMVVHYNESQAEELVERGLIARGGKTDSAIRSAEVEVLPRLDGLVFVSEFMLEHLSSQLPRLARVRSCVVPNFVRAVEAGPPAAPMGDCISVGSLVERKNHAYLLYVLAAARRHGHRYTLTIVGDGPLRGSLQGLARRLGLADQVTFTGARYDVEELLPRHRVYVHGSTQENCPFAVIEALRSALPVIVGAVGGIPEVVGAEGAGRFWDLQDPEAGARELSALLEDQTELAAAADAAAARFHQKYHATVAGRDLVRFLDEVRQDAR